MTVKKTIDDLMISSQVSFGTSGARGLVKNMTDAICYYYTQGFILHLKHSHQLGQSKRIAIAGDLRSSTPKIINACAKAIIDQGLELIYCGFIASPAIALFGIENQIATLMITGSHIPDDRNGIKFNTPQGEILKTDEQLIRKQNIVLSNLLFDKNGSFQKLENYLPPISSTAQQLYRQRYTDFFDSKSLADLKLGVYQHSGVARDDIISILKSLGADVIALNRSDTFIPVDTEAVREEDHNLAIQWQQQYHFDAILSTDGDADRPLISDEKGNWLRGDMIGILCAQYLNIKHLVTPVSSNTAVEKSNLFQSVVRSKIGSPYVIDKMNQLLNEGNSQVAGYEANGGFLIADDLSLNHKILKKLPTRDAIIVMLSLLQLSKMNKKPLSLLADLLPQRFTYSDRIKNISTQVSQQIIQNYQDKIKVEADFGHIGMQTNQLAHIDNTDGLRLCFKNQNIIHFRASGNAPEFRCYTEANTIALAKQLNVFCLEKIAQLAKG